MKKREKVKSIIFDVGGVLSIGKYSSFILKREYLGVHQHLAKTLGLDIDSWFDTIDKSYSDSIEGRIDERKAVKIISNNLNINHRKLENIVIKTYKLFFKRNNELYSLAYSLRKKGYIVGILSDQWPLSKKALISKEDFKLFNPVIISCDVGVRKPDPKIYKLLFKKIKEKDKKIKISEILFIDNRNWNLNPAKKLGMKVILFRNNKQLFKKLEAFGVFKNQNYKNI